MRHGPVVKLKMTRTALVVVLVVPLVVVVAVVVAVDVAPDVNPISSLAHRMLLRLRRTQR